jgi:hypothetical protein
MPKQIDILYWILVNVQKYLHMSVDFYKAHVNGTNQDKDFVVFVQSECELITIPSKPNVHIINWLNVFIEVNARNNH